MLLPSHLNPIFFSSTLSDRHYDQLEALMFFNPQQDKFRQKVSQLVERYGNPKIVQEQNSLRLQIGSEAIAQTLFSLDRPINGNLIGVVVYIRESIEYLSIIHLAVKEEYMIFGQQAEQLLVLRLIQKVQEIGTRLKGVEYVRILYNQSLKKNSCGTKLLSHLK